MTTNAREAAVLEYMRGMREMVAAQRDVMMAYLGQPQPAQTQVQAVQPVVPAPAPAPAPAPESESVPEAVSAAPPAAEPQQDIETTLIAIVSDRTGYPVEMLELDLDLEAELSIDSIKRIEILGELRERIGLTCKTDASDEEVIEQLSTLKTLREIISWLETNRADAPQEPAPQEPAPQPVHATPLPEPALSLERYEIQVQQAPPPALNGTTLDNRVFAITDDGRGIAPRVAALLQSHGATARVLSASDATGDIDGLIHLQGLGVDADHRHVKRLFALAKEAALCGAEWIVAATALGGRFGRGDRPADTPLIGGPSGMLKTFAREWPQLKLRLVDVDPTTADPNKLAASLVSELLVVDRFVEVGYADNQRYQLSAVATPMQAGKQLALTRDSVVLITGGARGITARAAVAIAERYRCHLVLVGRSPYPVDSEDPAYAGAADRSDLRKLLVEQGMRQPKAIEAECTAILRAREIRNTITAIRNAGATVDYHSVDVRDAAAFGLLMDSLDRIDGVIHGAGVIEDKLIRDKTSESFDRVFDTKVSAARVIAERLIRRRRGQTPEFVAFFGSVSGVFGNRGQVAYAAANDALDKIALDLSRRITGRVVSVDWGPWAGTGMVSAELEREYAQRGVGLIPPDQGIDQLLAELANTGSAQVVMMCASPTVMALPEQGEHAAEHQAE